MATRKKAGNGKDEGEGFDQGGADGARKQRNEGHNKPKKFEGKVLIEALETIAAAETRMKRRMQEASKKNQPDRDAIKSATKDLVDSGYPSKELATLKRKHKLQRQIEGIDSTLDDEQKETFAQMVEAIGDFGSTDLGKAALERHPENAHH